MDLTPSAGEPWTSSEVEALLDAYFDIMVQERSGLNPVKAAFNRHLQGVLPARSRGSIEYKLQNVSAVLNEIGKPWIDGYKPAPHYQSGLKPMAEAWLRAHPGVAEDLEAYGDQVPPIPSIADPDDLFVPVPGHRQKRAAGELHLNRGDWGALKDARNRALGNAGEEWVINVEQAILSARGRTDLAERVEWVSKTIGDGLGYDVLSYTADGNERLIEVKTTNLGARSPFYLTRREVAVSAAEEDRYRLYRVFNFGSLPRVFTLAGNLSGQLDLEPLLYHARL